MSVQRFFMNRLLKMTVGEMTDYGLPKPDHKLLEAHPTVSSELLPRIGHGDITVKPNIERFAGGRTVRFADGSEEEIDLVIYCTGYKIELPLPRRERLRRPGQPDAALQARRLGREPRPLLHRLRPAAGPDHAHRRGPVRMDRRPTDRARRRSLRGGDAQEIAAYERWLGKRFVASKRHTIEVDFHPYLREIRASERLSGRLGRRFEGRRRGAPPGCWVFRLRQPTAVARLRLRAKKRTPLRGGAPRLLPKRRRRREDGAGRGAGWAAGASVEAVAGVLGGAVGLRRLARPPDEPERAEDRDLQHDEQKEDRPEPLHRRQCRRA